jgi:hypothetical protein
MIRPNVIAEYAVWAVITVSVLFYFVLSYVLAKNGLSAGIRSADNVQTVFYTAGALVAAASVLFRRYSFSDKHMLAIIKKDVDVTALSGSLGIERAGSGRSALFNALGEDELRAVTLMNELVKASIINLVLNEMVALLGFVLAFLSGEFMKIIPFGLASLLLNIWMFPRPESVIERSQKLFP